MFCSEVIKCIRAYCGQTDAFSGEPITGETTRDKVLYGSVDQECTGIVTCIWPSFDVIAHARECGANLIVTHEALFWNHGDHQEPLASNSAFLAKRDLLDAWGGVVWRCHDYIHAGVPLESDGSLVDGIFYGLAWKLGWLPYRVGDCARCLDYRIPATRSDVLAAQMVESLGLAGARIVGDSQALVERVRIPIHVMGGPQDTELSCAIDAEGVDCVLGMEFIDYTTCEYIRDAAMQGKGKCAIVIGHFNLEEPGMEFMARWLPKALRAGWAGDDIPRVTYVPDGDTYRYVVSGGDADAMRSR